jgi:predicted metal-dependent hydrolase
MEEKIEFLKSAYINLLKEEDRKIFRDFVEEFEKKSKEEKSIIFIKEQFKSLGPKSSAICLHCGR